MKVFILSEYMKYFKLKENDLHGEDKLEEVKNRFIKNIEFRLSNKFRPIDQIIHVIKDASRRNLIDYTIIKNETDVIIRLGESPVVSL